VKPASSPETIQGLVGAAAVTSPPPGSSDPVIAAAGDVACDPGSPAFNGGAGTATGCRQRYTSDLLVGAGLAAVLPLGDIQYEDGTPAMYQLSFDPTWGRLRDIIRPAIGNHEYLTPGAAGYFDYFNGAGNQLGPAGDRTGGYYSFEVGAWHLISLNSNCSMAGGCSAGSPQELWLQEDLAAHRATCTLAYWHHPHFSSGPHGNGVGENATDALWSDLYGAGADLVLNGHDHDYERFAPQTAAGTADPVRGIREFVVGTGGKSHYAFSTLRPNSEVRNADTFGVLKLVLHPESYDWSFVPEAGGTFADSGSDTCHQ
jgi:3',5'-cyclic AMP phosphodiesterase CpdA